jgi:hypothetical protein
LTLNKGIPSNADLNQLEDHWRKCHQANPHALTVLTKLFRNMDEVKNFKKNLFFFQNNFCFIQLSKFEQRIKYFNNCHRLSQLLVTYRDSISPLDSSSIDQLKPYKDLLIDLYLYDTNTKEKILELLKYQYYLNEIKQLIDWNISNFPTSGKMLALKGVKQEPNYKIILNELRQEWKKSHFKATESQLVDETLPIILKNLTTSTTQQKIEVNPPAFALLKKT